MALRVACPNGCRLQVPKSRAGMMVRCPKCKKVIKLAELSAATKSDDGMDSIDAVFPTRKELVELKKTVKQAADRSNLVRKSSAALQMSNIQPEKPAAEKQIFQVVAVAPVAEPKPAGQTTADLPREGIMFIEPAIIPAAEQSVKQEQRSPSKPKPEKRWRMPEDKREKKPSADPVKLKARKPTEKDSPPHAPPRATSPSSAQAALTAKRPAKLAARPAPPTEIIEAEPVESKTTLKATEKSVAAENTAAENAAAENAAAATKADEATNVKTVGVSHSKDAKARAVFLTFALVLIAAFAIVPAVRSFVGYVNTNGNMEIPRWAAWLVFLGVLHIVYAFYVAQLADWTSFRIVSIMMLILTAVMATLLAGMALGGQGGFVSRLFQIPMSLTTKAEIWLLTMLSITSLISFLSGREAFRWKKTENQLRAATSPD